MNCTKCLLCTFISQEQNRDIRKVTHFSTVPAVLLWSIVRQYQKYRHHWNVGDKETLRKLWEGFSSDQDRKPIVVIPRALVSTHVSSRLGGEEFVYIRVPALLYKPIIDQLRATSCEEHKLIPILPRLI